MENKHVERSRVTRERLLTHARELFGARGYAGVGTEEIVRAAGVTRGALYHQFAGKEALFEAVVVAVEADTTAQAATMAAGSGDALEQLRAGTRAFLEVCADPGVERILLIDAPAVLGWERWREICMEHSLGVVTALLEAGMAAGTIARRPTSALAHLLVGAIDEGARFAARAADRDAARAEVDAVVDQLLGALSP